MKSCQWVLNCISQRLSKETDLAILSRHLGQNSGCMECSTVRHTKMRLVCVRLPSRHTSLNYSALLAGSRGSHTSIFFNPSAVLSLVGFVLQQCQGWATEPGLGIIFQDNLKFFTWCWNIRTTNQTLHCSLTAHHDIFTQKHSKWVLQQHLINKQHGLQPCFSPAVTITLHNKTD